MNKFAMSVADTSKLIKSIKTRATNVQQDIHRAAVASLIQIQQDGNTNNAVALMNALPNGQRVKALATWFKAMSNKKFSVKQDKEQGNIWVAHLQKNRDASDFDIDTAIEKGFADYTTEREPQEVTLDKMVKYLKGIAENDEFIGDATADNAKPKVSENVRSIAVKLLSIAEAAQSRQAA
jgi:hypothetical protein